MPNLFSRKALNISGCNLAEFAIYEIFFMNECVLLLIIIVLFSFIELNQK